MGADVAAWAAAARAATTASRAFTDDPGAEYSLSATIIPLIGITH